MKVISDRCADMVQAPPQDRSAKRGWRIAAFAIIAALYALTAARFAQGGDGGEFAALFVRGGVAHPPGYPLFVLYLRAWSWLPLAEPAHAAAIATSVLGVLAAFLLFRASCAFGASERSSALMVAIFAGSPLTWKLATYPEVFIGNVVIALAIVWLASPMPPLRGAVRAASLAGLAGLGLAHHHTIVLLAPLGLLGFAAAIKE